MDRTRYITFGEWAQQIYGPPVVPALNARNVVAHLVHAKRLRDSLAPGLNSPPTQPDPAESSSDTSTTLDTESEFAARTHETTPKSHATTEPVPPWVALNNKSAPLNHTTGEPSKEKLPNPPPRPRLGEMSQWMYDRLSRIDQLEYLVKRKIKTFREDSGARCIFRNTNLFNIDREEGERRRRFFEKNGEEAFLTRYIDSDYTGRVELIYIDPEEAERRYQFFEKHGREAFLTRYSNSDYTGRFEFLYIDPEEVD